MKNIHHHRCNHCGGLMRTYMDCIPTCLNCGRYSVHQCGTCMFPHAPAEKRKRMKNKNGISKKRNKKTVTTAKRDIRFH